jgi:hypothetical protein
VENLSRYILLYHGIKFHLSTLLGGQFMNPIRRNNKYCANYIRTLLIPEVEVWREMISNRLIPTFDNSESEADKIADKVWGRLNAMANEDFDPYTAAEMAEDKALDCYLTLRDARQSLINLSAVALSHLIEQHRNLILDDGILTIDEQGKKSLYTLEKFIEGLLVEGIDVVNLKGWTLLQELRHVGNAVKHGEGRSMEYLRKNRPDLWERASSVKGSPLPQPNHLPPILTPLTGVGLYLTETDLKNYFNAAVNFYNVLQLKLKSL